MGSKHKIIIRATIQEWRFNDNVAIIFFNSDFKGFLALLRHSTKSLKFLASLLLASYKPLSHEKDLYNGSTRKSSNLIKFG